MKLTEILSMISAPKGLTSILNGIAQNDFSVLPHQKGLEATMFVADEKIAFYQKQLDECKSDWSYWSILGDLVYWKAVKNILKGAELVGENNMPDVKFENKAEIVMDSIADTEKFGKYVLSECERIAK